MWNEIDRSYIEEKSSYGANYLVGNFNTISSLIKEPEMQQELRLLIKNAGEVVFERNQLFIVDISKKMRPQ